MDGLLVGERVGKVKLVVGFLDGEDVSTWVIGALVGGLEGLLVGMRVEGLPVGENVGNVEFVVGLVVVVGEDDVGVLVGFVVGELVKRRKEGDFVGVAVVVGEDVVGFLVGSDVGFFVDGLFVGFAVGVTDGTMDLVGESVTGTLVGDTVQKLTVVFDAAQLAKPFMQGRRAIHSLGLDN